MSGVWEAGVAGRRICVGVLVAGTACVSLRPYKRGAEDLAVDLRENILAVRIFGRGVGLWASRRRSSSRIYAMWNARESEEMNDANWRVHFQEHRRDCSVPS
jgi:hypothetical protein